MRFDGHILNLLRRFFRKRGRAKMLRSARLVFCLVIIEVVYWNDLDNRKSSRIIVADYCHGQFFSFYIALDQYLVIKLANFLNRLLKCFSLIDYENTQSASLCGRFHHAVLSQAVYNHIDVSRVSRTQCDRWGCWNAGRLVKDL